MRGLTRIASRAASLDTFFAGMPEPVREYFVRGFLELAELAPDHHEGVGDLVAAALSARDEPEDSEIERVLGFSSSAVRAALAAATLLAALQIRAEAADQHPVSDLVSAGIIREENQEAIEGFAEQALKANASIGKSAREGDIGSSVLPSLYLFEAAVEARFGFRNNRVDTIVPVAVVHIETDAPEGGSLFLQVTQPQLEGLLKRLKEVDDRMKLVRQWVSARTDEAY